MLVSLTVGKVDAGVTVLLTPDKRLIEFPSILLPPDISSGSIVDITVARNAASEDASQRAFRALQDHVFASFGVAEPAAPVLRCKNATQTSVVLEWDPVQLATADLISLSLYRNGQKAGAIPRPLQMHSTKISGLAVDTEYEFHLVLRTTAGTFASERVAVRTHKMTDLSGITITPGIMPPAVGDALARAVDRIGARVVDGVRIDTTHFVTTEGRGPNWEKANELNIPVVRPEWVEACERNGRILGVTKFYLDAVMVGGGGMATTTASSTAVDDQQQQTPPHHHQPIPQTASARTAGGQQEEASEQDGSTRTETNNRASESRKDEAKDKAGEGEEKTKGERDQEAEDERRSMDKGKQVAIEDDGTAEEVVTAEKVAEEEKGMAAKKQKNKAHAEQLERQRMAARPKHLQDATVEDAGESDGANGAVSPGARASFENVQL